MKKKFLFIMRQAPYGTSIAREALDIIFMASAFEQSISVLFLGDGIFQLRDEQDSSLIQRPNLANALRALPMYDVTQLYVARTDLEQRACTQEELILPVTSLESEAISQLMHDHDVILSF